MPTTIEVGTVTNDDIWAKVKQRIDAGDMIIITNPESVPVEEEPEPARSCYIVGIHPD